eukprot:SAG11_NODE_8096_length_1060_cov_3.484901_1_plen_48_part_10
MSRSVLIPVVVVVVDLQATASVEYVEEVINAFAQDYAKALSCTPYMHK